MSTWSRARRILEAALDLPATARAAFVRAECGDDAELCAQVERLLALEADGDAPIEALVDDARSEARAAALAPRQVLERVGRYRLVRVIAHGGMGTVYEAEQEEPRRRVAVKVMNWGLVDAQSINRFRFEAEVLGRLQHPGIAQILEAGTQRVEDVVPFFAMEFVEDARTILEYANLNRLDTRARVALFVAACEAVHFGHQNGVVHRDIKPANVLVNGRGEVKLIDFGIARACRPGPSNRTQVTETGQIVGTLQYMSPEQFGGDHDGVDTRSDVYSLGVLLYELLCGVPPHDLQGKSLHEAARIICQDTAVGPRSREPRLDPDLEWIALKALEIERARRYASASELAADLARFLVDEPVLAGPPSGAYRLKKFIRRNSLAVGAASIVALALVVGAIGTTVGMLRARDAEAEARVEALRATMLSQLMGDTLYSISPEMMGAEVRLIDVLRATRYDREALRAYPEVEAEFNRLLGRGLLSVGESDEALEHLRVAHELSSTSSESGTSRPLHIAALYVQALAQTGHEAEARAVLDEALAQARESPGPNPEALLDLRRIEAIELLPKGSDPRLELLEEVYAEALRTLGAGHRHTQRTGLDYAFELRERGRFDDARKLVEAVLAIAEQRSPKDEVDVLLARRDLGILLRLAGDLPRAEALFDALVPDWRTRFGSDMRATGLLRLEQALVKKFQGKLDEARAIVAEELERRIVRFPDRDELNAVLLAELADIDARLEDFTASEREYERAVAAALAAFSPGDLRAINAQLGQARLWLSTGEDARGEQALRELLARTEEQHGGASRHLVEILHLLAVARLGSDTQESLALFERGAVIARKSLEPQNSSRIGFMVAFGFALSRSEELESAAEILREALDGIRVHGVKREAEGVVLQSLVNVSLRLQDEEQAERYRAELEKLSDPAVRDG